jgi:hypothetical protein
MAVLDRSSERWLEMERNAVEAFREFIRSDEGLKTFPEGRDLIRHIDRQGAIIRDQNIEMKKYRDFFGTLSSLLPRQFSASDRIE